jgi:hypothetical protein
MHGIELCRQKRRTIRCSAPRWPFSPAPGSMPSSSPLAASCPEPVARNGFSLVRNSCRLSATSIPGSSSQPATSLPSKYAGCARSALRLHYRVPDCAGCGRFTACGPLHFHHSVRPAAPTISTPLRDCYLPRDQSVNRLCCLPVHLTNPPDFPSLPAARPNKSLGCGSSFQVRYVSAGLLFLKPLGTFFTMLPMCFSVNVFWCGIGPFPQHLYFLVSVIYGDFLVNLLWIKRAPRVVILRYCNRKCAGL